MDCEAKPSFRPGRLSVDSTIPFSPNLQGSPKGMARALSMRSPLRAKASVDDFIMDAIWDDDFLVEFSSPSSPRDSKRNWRTLHAVFIMLYAGRNKSGSPKKEFVQAAGHEGSFLTEDGYVLKILTENEGVILESLHKDRVLRQYAPQYMGCVVREGRTYIKMQDVFLSMAEPNFMDVKMGLRTFAEGEVRNEKRRMDLLKKALLIQQDNPAVYITEEEKQNGITKHRFMSLRDHASSSATLGFRVQGVMKDQTALTSKDFSTIRSATTCRSLFRAFFEKASPEQRLGLLQRLKDLYHAASGSDWFATHEVIGSSLLIGYDTMCSSKFGLWMIDFARTELAPQRLTHMRPWTLGSQEDGYLLGVQSLIKIWSDEFQGDIPLDAADWHYRAEGHDCIVVGYHGGEGQLQGKVLRLAKEASTGRFRNTFAGHPATAYNDFVSTMLADYIGPAADPGYVVHVDRPFLEAVAERVASSRPAFRVQHSSLDFGSEYQLLLEDGSYVPGAPHQQTIAVELKLKMGHLPPPTQDVHPIKCLVSRFAMQQYHKLNQGSTGKISKYCPVDLFSGDFDRMQNVLFRLLDTPQNNLRVFLGNTLLVPKQEGHASSLESGKMVLDKDLAEVTGNPSSSLYLSELVAKCLLQRCPTTGLTLLQKLQNLQRLGLDIEVLWPLVQHSVGEIQQIYHVDQLDVAAVSRDLPPSPALYCKSRQQQERRGRRPGPLSDLAQAVEAARHARAAETAAVAHRIAAFDGVLETRKFLLSQSLKDCSLMVALAAVPEEAAGAPDVVQGSDGQWWRFGLRLVDLDAKNVGDLRKWYLLDQDIVHTYLREVYGVSSEEARDVLMMRPPELQNHTTTPEPEPEPEDATDDSAASSPTEPFAE